MVSDPRNPGGTLNGRILDAILRHRHFILRMENGVVGDLAQPLREARQQVARELFRLAQREALSDLSELRRIRLLRLEESLTDIIARTSVEVEALAFQRFEAVAARELEVQNNLLRRVIPNAIGLDLVGPDPAMLGRIIREPLGGKRFEERMRRNFGEMADRMRRNLATSVALGEGIAPAAARLRKTVTTIGVNRATLIARSEIQRVANRTALESYRRNRDVIKSIRVVETLDARTCPVCMAKDGNVLPLNADAGELPPYHAACRGFTTPITRSFQELGVSLDEFPPGTRASMDGQVPDVLTYPEWFAQQPESFQREVLGPARFERFKQGGLALDAMVKDERILRIDELPEAA